MLFGRNPPDFLIGKTIDFRDSAMPDSPDTKVGHPTTLSPKALLPSIGMPQGRPLSSNSIISGINGSHSPLSTLNGRTPSPPMIGSLMNSSMGQQLPPACGARQLSKLKRFLTTLQQFGSDISPEIGDRVRSLVLGLVNSHLSIEEFHSKLQEATNFPLRPFVIPFLKANLPLLQRELLHCARMAKQTPQQFLAQNEQIVFDPSHSPLDARESVLAPADVLNENGKRSSPDRPKENGLDLHLESPHPAKRHHSHSSHPVSPVSSTRVSPGSQPFSFGTGPIRLEDISKSRELRERERLEREQVERERAERERERDRERHYSSYSYRSADSLEHLERLDDDWRHVETMLNCIIGMVDKTKRAMAVIQERSLRDREELSVWARRQAEGMDMDVKKRSSSESMAFTLRQTEDRVIEVRRRAEEAVNDVKRQAMMELQKAVTAADQKASTLVAAERSKMERTIAEARKQTQEDIMRSFQHQEETAESCWNCGRKASETCSGCNVARYCGAFCQHKDWESHHHVCGKAHITSAADAREQRRIALAAAAAAVAATTSAPSFLSSSSSSLSSSSALSNATPAPANLMATKDTSSSSHAALTSQAALTSSSTSSISPAPSAAALKNHASSSLSSSSSSSSSSSPSSTALASLTLAPATLPSLSGKEHSGSNIVSAAAVAVAPTTTMVSSSPSTSPRSPIALDSNPNSPTRESDSASCGSVPKTEPTNA